MADARQWISGARPRTLPAAIAPVLVGTGAAAALDGARPVRAMLALLVSLALQVGVNYANDYSDGIRGTDDDRVGPFRLTASGAAPPAQVRAAAFTAFGVAGGIGVILVALSGSWWLLGVGAGCVAAAWFYTGGSRPYGYAGLGEVFVFVFFGLVAVLGTTYTQAGRISEVAISGAVGVGCLACAILVVNNLRDVPTDRIAGKQTLAVRIGVVGTRRLYLILVLGAVVAVLPVAFVTSSRAAYVALQATTLVTVAVAGRPVHTVLRGAAGRDLIPVLRDTGRLELIYAALLAVGIALS